MQVNYCKEGDLHSLLGQILDELRAIRVLLERGANTSAVQPSGAAPSYIQVQTPVYTAEHAKVFLARYLKGRKLQIVEATDITPENEVMRQRMHLAYFMGQHYKITRKMLDELRATLQQPRKVRIDLSEASQEAISVLTNTGKRLLDLYMLTCYEYHRKESIHLKVRPQPFVHNYLSGGWFELYVAQEAQKILGDRLLLAKRNVKLEAEGGAFCEADLLLVVRRKPNEMGIAVLECKSANALYDEEPRQVKRLVNLLNLGMQRSAIVFPDTPSPAFAERWFAETGAQVIGRKQLAQFLESL